MTNEQKKLTGATDIIFILDRSGSMSGLEEATIKGFNDTIAEQQQVQDRGEAFVTTVLFDNVIEVLHQNVNLRQISQLTTKEYFTRGCTALLDAIGSTLDQIKARRKALPKEERPAKTIMVITTDGMENASCHYDYAKIKKMIVKRREKGWQFVFLGANIDALDLADHLGIAKRDACNFVADRAGIAYNSKAQSSRISSARCCQAADENWDKEISEYYHRRKKQNNA